jgi:quinol monooxygenase YgiN
MDAGSVYLSTAVAFSSPEDHAARLEGTGSLSSEPYFGVGDLSPLWSAASCRSLCRLNSRVDAPSTRCGAKAVTGHRSKERPAFESEPQLFRKLGEVRMPENSLRVVARIIALPDRVEEARAILLELIALTRKEPGCITYELLQNKSDPTDFTFVEEWENENAFDSHAVSNHIKDVTIKLRGVLSGTPDIRRYSLVR